jgi:hypothetical protein
MGSGILNREGAENSLGLVQMTAIERTDRHDVFVCAAADNEVESFSVLWRFHGPRRRVAVLIVFAALSGLLGGRARAEPAHGQGGSAAAFEQRDSREKAQLSSVRIASQPVEQAPLPAAHRADGLKRVPFNNPGLVVDLAVGLWAWPLPMDYDGDGDMDLVVVCPDKPYSGTYFFENAEGRTRYPIFRRAVRIADAVRNAQVSYVEGRPVVTTPGWRYPDFRAAGFSRAEPLSVPDGFPAGKVRANQWKLVDYDADGILDLVVGTGDWSDYGWDDAFDDQGRWTRGPLHGRIHWLPGVDPNGSGVGFGAPLPIEAAGTPVDVYGMPSPNVADFDGDGDLDLMCGEFLDQFTYFENTGSREQPRFAAGRRLCYQGRAIAMDLQMITPTAVDWDADGDQDLVVGDEDGRVALVEHTGQLVEGQPQFLPPVYFQQEADSLKFGALVTPVSHDWDGDGDEDLICGNTAGYIGWIENLGLPAASTTPKWAGPARLKAGGRTLRIMAGANGSIQGPCEAKWGYTTLAVADWDHDGLADLVVNSIWGRVVWFRNVGTPNAPQLAPAESVRVAWRGRPPKPSWTWWTPEADELATQWRTTPCAVDWTGDARTDLIMLDHEGYLALFERSAGEGNPPLEPGRRIFQSVSGDPLRLNAERAGKSGRRKLCIVDWDGDQRLDLLVNSRNASLWRQTGRRAGIIAFEEQGPLSTLELAGHSTSPTTVDWDGDGIRELLIGAEDGHFYHLPRR